MKEIIKLKKHKLLDQKSHFILLGILSLGQIVEISSQPVVLPSDWSILKKPQHFHSCQALLKYANHTFVREYFPPQLLCFLYMKVLNTERRPLHQYEQAKTSSILVSLASCRGSYCHEVSYHFHTKTYSMSNTAMVPKSAWNET